MSERWLSQEHSAMAAQSILDAATGLFVEHGVSAVGMADVAKAAGCSRQTLYRYFSSRQDLHLAFVHREAVRLATQVSAEVGSIKDPAERLVRTIVTLLDEVRSTDYLAAWFKEGETDVTTRIVSSTTMIEELSLSFFARPAEGQASDHTIALTRWCIRVMLSMLITPGADKDDERHMLEQFVAPLVRAAVPAH